MRVESGNNHNLPDHDDRSLEGLPGLQFGIDHLHGVRMNSVQHARHMNFTEQKQMTHELLIRSENLAIQVGK